MIAVRVIKLIVVVVIALTVSSVHASEPVRLQLLAGLPKPPYIIEENGEGLQLEIIRQALKLSNIDVNFVHMPLGRQINAYQQLRLDGIITLPEQYQGVDIFLSEPYVNYQNVAISLSANNFNFENIEQLADKRLSAFQNASLYLGDSYERIADEAPYYEEVADQNKQMRNLFEEKVEVVIADLNIYKYFIRTHQHGIFNKATSVHQIFDERPYVVGFRRKDINDKFSLGVAALKQSGRYQAILDKYLALNGMGITVYR